MRPLAKAYSGYAPCETETKRRHSFPFRRIYESALALLFFSVSIWAMALVAHAQDADETVAIDSVPLVDTLPSDALDSTSVPDALFIEFEDSSGPVSELIPGNTYRLAVGFPATAAEPCVQAGTDEIHIPRGDLDCEAAGDIWLCYWDFIIPPNLTLGAKTIIISADYDFAHRRDWLYTISVGSPSVEPSATSSVLFLPGIEGSRLYDADSEKLWEPVSGLSDFLSGNAHVRKLFLDANGESVEQGIHTRSGDVIRSAGGDIYGAFLAALDEWKGEQVIHDWRALAYDWRLSLDDILADGSIGETLRSLASSSPSGKVTIIAHSNGGLLAKALLEKLGTEAPSLVDTVVLAGAPQGGAPEALGSILYGQDLEVSIPRTTLSFPYVSKEVTREFAQNAPMAYHLLPSAAYFSSYPTSPLVSFNGAHAYADDVRVYGSSVDSWQELAEYLSMRANGKLISYAERAHEELDSWIPPAGIAVYQVGGVGADTISGIEYYEEPAPKHPDEYVSRYRPAFTTEGDGTVPAISALLMPESDAVHRYWFDFGAFNARTHDGRSHASMLGADSVLEFVRGIFMHATSSPPADMSKLPPAADAGRIRFMLHSPLSLDLYDEGGDHTGLNPDGSLDEEIPDSLYGEFGDVKYITAPAGGKYELELRGEGAGDFSLDIQQSSRDEATTSTIAGVPAAASTTASLTVSETGTTSPLIVDENGDGISDFSITPIFGETVFYEAPQKATSTESEATSTDPNASASTTPEQAPELIQELRGRASHGSHPHAKSSSTISATVAQASSTAVLLYEIIPPGAYVPAVQPRAVVATSVPQIAAAQPAITEATSVPQNTQSSAPDTQLASAHTAEARANVFARALYGIGNGLSSLGSWLIRLSGIPESS